MTEGPAGVKGEVVLALYDERAQALLRRWPADRHNEIARRLGVCESPIEVLFALALLSAKAPTGSPVLTLYTGANDGELLATSARFHLLAQHGVTVEGRRVRLDFALVPVGATGTRLAIELDGHGFHSSKEALESDASRDRALTRAGWTPIRFRGGEAWADPDACAAEALASVGVRVRDAEPLVLPSEVAHLAECNDVFGDDVPIRLDDAEQRLAAARGALLNHARRKAAHDLDGAATALDGIPSRGVGRVIRAAVDGLRDDVAELRAVLAGER